MKSLPEGWRDDLVVKSAYSSPRGLKLGFQHQGRQLTTFCSSNSKGSGLQFFWPPQASVHITLHSPHHTPHTQF